MSWNYRLTMERKPLPDSMGGGEETVYAIREVYYDEHGKVNGWTADPVYPRGETWEEFTKDFAHYQAGALIKKSEIIDVTEVGERTKTDGG